MYYSNGNYEAFARPLKPEGVDHKSAYIIGTGLAALTAASPISFLSSWVITTAGLSSSSF